MLAAADAASKFQLTVRIYRRVGELLSICDLGIAPELESRPVHARYLASWLSVLKNEKRFIVQAAAQARRAVAYLHDLQSAARQLVA